MEQKNYHKALDYPDKAIELEPDHPLIVSEKALALSGQGKLSEAVELYLKAHDARPWADRFHKAWALRGAAVCLLDFRMLDQAERLLEIFLRLEIGNKLALKELAHIRSADIYFEGEEDHGVDVVADMSLKVDRTGIYWHRLFLDDIFITQMPLRIVYMNHVTGLPGTA
jgi:tetratricopeptide (TPR) repeat protein